MYADDTNVFLKNNCYEKLYKVANQELINIENWLSANQLILNIDKTHYSGTSQYEFNSFRDRARNVKYSYCEAIFCIMINVKINNPFQSQNLLEITVFSKKKKKKDLHLESNYNFPIFVRK